MKPAVRQVCEFDSVIKRDLRGATKGRSGDGDGYLEVLGVRNWPGRSLETPRVGVTV